MAVVVVVVVVVVVAVVVVVVVLGVGVGTLRTGFSTPPRKLQTTFEALTCISFATTRLSCRLETAAGKCSVCASCENRSEGRNNCVNVCGNFSEGCEVSVRELMRALAAVRLGRRRRESGP